MCRGTIGVHNVKHFNSVYNDGRSKMELQYNLDYRHSFTGSTTIWLKSEESDKYILHVLHQLGEKYKKIIREFLEPEKSIIIFDVPTVINGKDFMVTIHIAALMGEKVTKSKLVDYSEILIPIFESYIQELNALMIIPTRHARKNIRRKTESLSIG